MKKLDLKQKAGVLACAAAMSMTMAVPAFAADNVAGNTGTTEVTVKTDPATTQVTWEAPTQIAFSAAADGTLAGPSADAVQIVNKSVFPIHVTNVAAQQTSPFNLVADVSTGDEANAIQFSLKTGATNVAAAAGMDTSSIADFDMGYAGSGTDALSVEANAGKVARTTVDLSTPQQAATVTWTVAAGSHTAA